MSAPPLSRERNRLTLRAYLQAVLAQPYVLNSPILRSFLLSSPTKISSAEVLDCQRRLEADAVREEGRKRFRAEAEKRVEALREGLQQFKGDVLSRDGGLKGVFDVVRRVDKVQDLPKAEASVLEWGRISSVGQPIVTHWTDVRQTRSHNLPAFRGVGHGVGHSIVAQAAPRADAVFRAKGDLEDFKSHGDDPRYLRVAFPEPEADQSIGVLDLFLARPFGGQSLLQRSV